MSTNIKITSMFTPAEEVYLFTLQNGTKFEVNAGARSADAHWYLGIELLTDEDWRTASIHQYSFQTKPSRKQLSQHLRKAMYEHEVQANANLLMTNEYIFTRSQLNGDTEEDLYDVLCIKNARAAIKKALGE